MKPPAMKLVSIVFIIALSLGALVMNTPAALAAGDISGTVTGGPGVTLANICVEAYDATTGDWVDSTFTGVDGHYTLTNLEDGQEYKILFTDPNGGYYYAYQWYTEALDFLAAAAVIAPATLINAELAHGVEISGTVTEEGSGIPLEYCDVTVYDATSRISLITATTFADGEFMIAGLNAAIDVKVYFDDNGSHIPEWYDSKDSWNTADLVAPPTLGLNIQLAIGGTGTISGMVTDGSAAALEGIEANAYLSETGEYVAYAFTDSSGAYDITGLNAGVAYKVFFRDLGGNWAAEWFSAAGSFSAANPVTASVTGVDAQLEAGVTITGTVTAEGSGIPVPWRTVSIYDATQNTYLWIDAQTNVLGEYSLEGLKSGTAYKVRALTEVYEPPEWYNGKNSWATADIVAAPATDIGLVVPYAAIAGNVTDGSGAPLGDIKVSAYNAQNECEQTTFTDSSGDFILQWLVESAEYNILFSDDTGTYAMEWFSNAGTLAEATGVVAPYTGINAQLEDGVIVSGMLLWEHSGDPVVFADVFWMDPATDFEYPLWTSTDENGGYSLGGLRSATGGKVLFSYYSEQTRWYHGKSDWAGADVVTAPATDVNDTLHEPQLPLAITSITPNSGLMGQTVTITNLAGQGFETEGSILVRLVSGTKRILATDVTAEDHNNITCRFNLQGVAPGRWDVNVKNPDGEQATMHDFFTVIAVAPSVTSVTPNSGPPGTTVTLKGNNFGPSQALAGSGETGRGASYVSFNGLNAAQYLKWTDTEIQAVVPDGASAGPVAVNTSGGSSGNANAFNVCSPTWYLAEGTSDWGFDTYVTIENPNPTAVKAKVTYMTKDGPRELAEMTLPALSQSTINPRNTIGATDFSTRVACTTPGNTIAVDRRMIWTGKGATSPEGHSSVGVTAPSTKWYLAEGSSKWGFECWLLIQNPNTREAHCKITYMIEGNDPIVSEKTVPASSRASYSMFEDIGPDDASIMVESDIAVIPERAMYRNDRREGHDSIGTTGPARDYFLAEGTSDWGFTTYVLVQNPNPSPANVTVTFMAADGPRALPTFQMAANSRKTINVNNVLPSEDFSTQVHADKPIVAERAMYWDRGWGEACHDSIGMPMPHKVFYFPDGETQNGYETWTLIQNPNDSNVDIKVEYLRPEGKGNDSFTVTMRGKSRVSYSMSDRLPNSRASVRVTCLNAGKKIMCERAMYWNGRGAGTDTIGGYSD